MSDEKIIPTTAVCAACGAQRGEHSAGSFHCPDYPSVRDRQAQFTDAVFQL